MKVGSSLLLCLLVSWALQVRASEVGETKLHDLLPNKKLTLDHDAAADQFTDQNSATPDIWTELRVLRDMVVKQNVELRTVKARLGASEKMGEDLRKENMEQSADLMDLRARLDASERRVEELKVQLENQAAELLSTQARVAVSENELQLLKTNTTEHQVDILIKDSAKVAFYAALTNSGKVGPHNTPKVLRFSKVFTNIGKAYSPTTGFFTAPVKGLYFFRFTVCSHRNEHIIMAVKLFHNGRSIMYNLQTWDNGYGHFEYMSNAVILELNVSDELHLVLPEGGQIYDNGNNHSTFSGFLLFGV
uniref:Cerebellin 17 n=1 Tax=Seriola lalandi dorsalis TaxID=1841481 RepID=A0A3B4WC75_SERLL